MAADVSSTELAEFTYFGLQVWDKVTETAQFSSPVTLPNFWCAGGTNGGTINCGTNSSLYDPEIVWDPPAQKWIATAGFFNPSTGEGDLLFAVSQTESAAGLWNTYTIPNACSQITGNSAYPFVDMPIVGYNIYWVVIEARCYTAGGHLRGPADTMVIIPNNPIPGTINVTPVASPFLDAAPSRDVAATASGGGSPLPMGYSDLFLVAPAAVGSQGPYLELAALDQTKTLTTLANSPSVGAVASSPQVPAVSCSTSSNPGCTILLGQSRITSVVLQTANDGFHYLMTAYAAEDASTSNRMRKKAS